MQTHESAALTNLRFIQRATQSDIVTERDAIRLNGTVSRMLECMPDFVLVLNMQRQILATNINVLSALGVSEPEHLIGLRPGEAMGCIHSDDGPNGCGTGANCFTCGAVGSILEAIQHNHQALRECRVTIGTCQETALDLQVLSTPIEIEGRQMLVCSLRDIAAEKRREVLERVFFHDIINTAGGIRGLADLLFDSETLDPREEQNFKKMMVELSDALIEEIKQQRELLAAERGNFEPHLEEVPVVNLMHRLYALYVNHDCARERILALESVPTCTMFTDKRIILRILGNLVKNALEATPPGGRVTLSARESGSTVSFRVKNPGVIPDEVKLQLFQRSFSTKGEAGRGIGTYSVKLFGERYLKGKIEFTSQEPDGTVFTFSVSRRGEPISVHH